VYAYAGNAPHIVTDETGLNPLRPPYRPPVRPGYDAFGRPALDFSRPRGSFGGSYPNLRGNQGESAVRNSCSIGESIPIQINGRTRIPDGINRDTLTEIKNRGYTPFNQQLRDSLDFARNSNRNMDLFLPPGGRVSDQLQRAIDSGQINRRDIPFP
jgi:hypothetical protein